MIASILVGTAYFASVFAAGIILGAIRVMLVVPAIGDLAGVLLELPFLLGWSWIVCGWLLRRMARPVGLSERAVMGATGFMILMTAEVGLSILAEDRSLTTWFSQYRDTSALAGLFGQVAFALIPLLR
jgi:hypothetical protein